MPLYKIETSAWTVFRGISNTRHQFLGLRFGIVEDCSLSDGYVDLPAESLSYPNNKISGQTESRLIRSDLTLWSERGWAAGIGTSAGLIACRAAR